MIRTLTSVIIDFKRYFDPRKRKGFIRSVVLLVSLGILAYFIAIQPSLEQTAVLETPDLPRVTLLDTDTLRTSNTIEVVGTVRADAEVEITAEATGRLTYVGIELGQRVSSGMTLARIENSNCKLKVCTKPLKRVPRLPLFLKRKQRKH